MLSCVADGLYWMSRYFERADNASRVLKTTYGLTLNPAKFSTEGRWFRAVSSLAPGRGREHLDPQRPLFFLVADPEGAFSIVKCISGARENARQVREEISSEMGERPNTLFHDISGLELQPDEDDDADAMRVGKADTQLPVRVRVTPSHALLPRDEEFASDQEWSQFLDETQQLHLVDAQQQQ